MLHRTLPIAVLALPLALCQCKTERRVTASDAQTSSLGGGADHTIAKFMASAEDSKYWTAEGETDPKKIKQAEAKRKRTVFEKSVGDSRKKDAFSKDTNWADHRYHTTDFKGGKEKKTFQWPWQKKEARTKESTMARAAREQDKFSPEATAVARESDDKQRDAGKIFSTDGYYDADHKARTFSNVTAERAPVEQPKIIQDYAHPDKDQPGWSVKDIRRFLNKR